MEKFIDLIGQQFGKLTVIERVTTGNKKGADWKCICSCGNNQIKIVRGNNLRYGNVKSCGCLSRKHGLSKTRIYRIWTGMIQRCHNPKNHAYKFYGMRGICVCQDWLNNFKKFIKDMGIPPNNMEIDRINNNLGYFKENCRWATRKQQIRNRTISKYVTYNGQTLHLNEWANKLGISANTLYGRFYYGWSVKRAFTTLVGSSKKSDRLFTINGITKNLMNWTSEYNIDYGLVSVRIGRLGWPIEKALSQPVNKNKRPKKYT